MAYPGEYYSSIITVSSVFIGIAGIVFAIILSSEKKVFREIIGWFILFLTGSIIAGILCMIFALDWLDKPSGGAAAVTGIALIIQFVLIILPLGVLIQPYLSRNNK